MSAIEPARLIDGDYVCARGPHHLAYAIPAGQSDRPGVVVEAYWRLAPPDPRDPTLTILTLTRHRRSRKADRRGRIRAPETFGYALPVLMPCRWPTCPQANRIDVDGDPH